ncbi:hypothetical protein MARA_45330 [Mycolicibacterium arabiense]|uniref:Uncharacterized protein n=1 Tax=Mycolicibacterium arabiense TaxID=1286181 RepID=A0A7I7S4Z3_9MYCO|nr:hypothetical protein [Mycolicibacterium arabiense]MCV7374779.1 hypothetical protein [Mycolicibacterium arabiense]BBY51065.1 hypothetical protein MARA_45330 [Mycolicibacterium arabiense]
MTSFDREQLRLLVREVVRDAVRDLSPQAPNSAPPPTAPTPVGTSAPAPVGPVPTGPLAADERRRTETVRIGSDADLDAFVRTLLRLFENPKTRADLRNGRLDFRLAGTHRGSGGSTHRIERGAVTERHVAEIADSGATLVLGPRAVLTPLARERARALGITIQKERT